MEINLYRQIGTPWGLMGTILVEGILVYRTLEHPTRHLPAGEYKVEIMFNKNYRKGWMESPIDKELINVPVIRKIDARPIKTASRIPFFMPGNGAFTLKHCYLDLYKVLEGAIGKGEEIRLIIQDIEQNEIPQSSVYLF